MVKWPLHRYHKKCVSTTCRIKAIGCHIAICCCLETVTATLAANECILLPSTMLSIVPNVAGACFGKYSNRIFDVAAAVALSICKVTTKQWSLINVVWFKLLSNYNNVLTVFVHVMRWAVGECREWTDIVDDTRTVLNFINFALANVCDLNGVSLCAVSMENHDLLLFPLLLD